MGLKFVKLNARKKKGFFPIRENKIRKISKFPNFGKIPNFYNETPRKGDTFQFMTVFVRISQN